MYFILSPYKEILAGIQTALAVNEGIIKLTGAAGTGKTALCSELYRELVGRGQDVVFFLNPPQGVEDMQQSILRQLRLDAAANFTRQLTAHLLTRDAETRTLVLIFDDAQQIDETTFTSIRMLCNIQSDTRALIRVIICGSRLLDERLAAASFRALTQFLSQSFTLPAMTGEQVNDFCSAWGQHIGLTGTALDARQLQAVYKETGGLPGVLLEKLKHESAAVVYKDLARTDLVPSQRKPTPDAVMAVSNKRRSAALAAGLVLLIGGGTLAYRFIDTTAQNPPAPVPVPVITAVQEPEVSPIVAQDIAESPAPQFEATAPPSEELALQPEVPAPQSEAEILSGVPVIPEPVVVEVPTTVAQVGAAEAENPQQSEAIAESAVELNQEQLPPALAVELEQQPSPPALAVELEQEPSPPESAVYPDQEVTLPEVSADTETAATAQDVATFSEPAADTAQAFSGDLPQATAEALLAAWTESWQVQDVDGFLAFYHRDFTTAYADSVAAWREQRRRNISNARDLDLSIDSLESLGGSATVQTLRFWLRYRSATYADDTQKELILQLQDGQWRIRAERNLQIIRL